MNHLVRRHRESQFLAGSQSDAKSFSTLRFSSANQNNVVNEYRTFVNASAPKNLTYFRANGTCKCRCKLEPKRASPIPPVTFCGGIKDALKSPPAPVSGQVEKEFLQI
jgi:hypothetical protein